MFSHFLMTMADATSAQPSFIVDAALASFLRSQGRKNSRQDISDKDEAKEESFGLLLLAGWQSPPNQQLGQPYERVLEIVRKCFDPEDYSVADSDLPAAYLYPPTALHITVASFLPFTHPRAQQHQLDGTQDDVIAFWKNEILHQALALSSWPLGSNNTSGNIELELDKVQIGKSAGILIWKEVNGTIIADIRRCIRQACDAYEKRRVEDKRTSQPLHDFLDAFAIPNITHSTFLRFPRLPSTPMAVVQERMACHQLVEEKIRILVPIRMVRERVPYMHNMNCDDEQHVLESLPIQ